MGRVFSSGQSIPCLLPGGGGSKKDSRLRKLIAAIHQLVKIRTHQCSVIDDHNISKLVGVLGKLEDIGALDCGWLAITGRAHIGDVNRLP